MGITNELRAKMIYFSMVILIRKPGTQEFENFLQVLDTVKQKFGVSGRVARTSVETAARRLLEDAK